MSRTSALDLLRNFRDGTAPPEGGSTGAKSEQITDAMLKAQAARVEKCLEQLRKNRVAILGDPVGTGKTAVALAAATILLAEGAVTHSLVSAPNTRVAHQWRDRSQHFPQPFETPTTPGAGFKRVPLQVRSRGTRGAGSKPKPIDPNRTLIIVDEAHKGLQNSSNSTYEDFTKLAKGCMVLFVTATPMQLDVAGLETMLRAADPDVDLGAVKRYHRELHKVVAEQTDRIANGTGEFDSGDDPLPKLQKLKRSSERQLRGYMLPEFDRKAAELGDPPKLEQHTVPTDANWMLGYQVARVVPELIDSGKGDMFQRRLVSSSEAFWEGTAGKQLESHRSGTVKALVAQLSESLGSGSEHPKVRETVRWTTERLDKGRKVLIFCVFHQSRDTLKAALEEHKVVTRRGVEVYAPRTAAEFEKQGTAFQKSTNSVMILTDKFSESVDIDGGKPCLVHHDLSWSPVRLDQRLGRIVRISTGFTQPDPGDIFVPVLDVEVDRRLFDTATHRTELTKRLLRGDAGVEMQELDDEDGTVAAMANELELQ